MAGFRAINAQGRSTPLTTALGADSAPRLNDVDLYGDSQDPYMQSRQSTCEGNTDFLTRIQNIGGDLFRNIEPPFSYDKETRRVTYRASDNHSLDSCNDMATPEDATLTCDMHEHPASNLQGHHGFSRHENGDASQEFVSQRLPTGEDSLRACIDGAQVMDDDNSVAIDRDRHAIVSDCWSAEDESDLAYFNEMPSLAQEARDEGLCQDYLLDDPFRPLGLPTPPPTQIDEMTDPYLTTGMNALGNPATLEKWEVDKDSASFLAQVMALGKDDSRLLLAVQDVHQTFADLRLIEPLLRCDPEQELENLRRKNAVTISIHGIRPFNLDVEKGEALAWPKDAAGLPGCKEHDARTEKLEVDRDVMLYLKELMSLPSFDAQEAYNACLRLGRARQAPQAMTPPLLPHSPPHSPPVLPNSMQQMPLTSSPEDLIAKDLINVNQSILRMDVSPDLARHNMRGFGQETTDPKMLFPGLDSLDDTSSPPEASARPSQLEVEVPMLAQSSIGTEHSREGLGSLERVSIPHDVQSLVPEPDPDLSVFDPDFAEKNLQEYLVAELLPVVGAINDTARSESLVEFDTTMRMPIPSTPLNEPAVPWRASTRPGGTGCGFSAQRALMGYTKHELLKGESHWGGVSRLERALHWIPFPARLGKVNLAEEIDDDKSASRYMADLELDEELDVNSLISKTDGLRLLDASESDDEELEPANCVGADEGDDGSTQPHTIPNPQREVGPSDVQLEPRPNSPIDVTSYTAPLLAPMLPPRDNSMPLQGPIPVEAYENAQPRPAEPARRSMSALLLKRKLELGQNGSEAADRPEQMRKQFKPSRVSDLFEGGGLVGFMGLQGRQADHPVHQVNHHHPQPIKPPVPAAVMVAPVASAPWQQPQEALSNPTMIQARREMQIVTSTQVVSNRALVRELQTMLPNLDMIERAAISAAPPGSNSSQVTSNPEADITLSPAAGLVMTTLQKLKQRSLPGQTAFFGVRERTCLVALHYERLTILVSEGRQRQHEGQTSSTALDPRDCEALADFMAFISTLDCDIDVRYVPGDERELTKWIAATISQSATITNRSMKLLPDETLWERFLRTAGLNAYAAQAILGQVKDQEAQHGSEATFPPLQSAISADAGLAAFVCTSASARRHHFGHVLGGDRVLSRVGGLIDGPWISTGVPKQV